MLCTYCGRGQHTAAGCPTRPRALLAVGLAILLAGCSGQPAVPPAKLAPPPAELMRAPEALEPIPACDGAVDCRTRYYARSRAQYAGLARQHVGLQRWVRVGVR